jgi:hypothetical protein
MTFKVPAYQSFKWPMLNQVTELAQRGESMLVVCATEFRRQQLARSVRRAGGQWDWIGKGPKETGYLYGCKIENVYATFLKHTIGELKRVTEGRKFDIIVYDPHLRRTLDSILSLLITRLNPDKGIMVPLIELDDWKGEGEDD